MDIVIYLFRLFYWTWKFRKIAKCFFAKFRNEKDRHNYVVNVSFITICPARLGRLPAIKMNKADIVMMPRPPVWIRTRMTSCPNELKTFPVSTTTRPVTHVAEVDVKRASTNPRLELFVAEGSIRRAVPMEMRIMKPMIEIRTGDWKSALEMRMGRFLYGALAAFIFYDLPI